MRASRATGGAVDLDPLERIAQEQLAIIEAGGYVGPGGSRVELRAAIDASIRGTRLLREDALQRLVDAHVPAATTPPRVRCLDERSGACVKQLLDEGARKVAVLNYANGVTPGGGFLHGSRAQEEALCRCSTLFGCLASESEDVRAYYEENAATGSALVLGHILVSPGVPFFRSEDLKLLDAPFVATVLTAAAPDLGWLYAHTSEGVEPKSRFDEVPGVFARRTRYVLTAARDAGCDAVVLGPWGCGAFGNDAEIVADAFAAALKTDGDGFAQIVFSTWGPLQNRDAFERRFKKNYAWDV